MAGVGAIDYQAQLGMMQRKYAKLEAQHKELNEKYRQAIDDNNILQIALDDLQESETKLVERNKMLDEENDCLATRCDDLQNEKSEVTTELHSYKKQVYDRLGETHERSPFAANALRHENEILKQELERLDKHNEALPMRNMVLPHDMDAIRLDVGTVMLPKQDSIATDSFVDPVTFNTNRHMLVKCGDRVYRYATRALDQVDNPLVQREIFQDMFDAMLETIQHSSTAHRQPSLHELEQKYAHYK